MMEDGTTITADKVLAAPGISHFMNLPAWYTDVPPSRRSHTSELVAFDELAGARVVIIGGRQSAYEWAALLCDHDAEHVDVVHRHSNPAFAKVELGLRRPVRRPDADPPGMVASSRSSSGGPSSPSSGRSAA